MAGPGAGQVEGWLEAAGSERPQLELQEEQQHVEQQEVVADQPLLGQAEHDHEQAASDDLGREQQQQQRDVCRLGQVPGGRWAVQVAGVLDRESGLEEVELPVDHLIYVSTTNCKMSNYLTSFLRLNTENTNGAEQDPSVHPRPS